MKKVVLAFILLILSVNTFAVAAPQTIDLETMSFADLVALKSQINLALWESERWEEVIVPQGIWAVGNNIPAKRWTVKAADGVTTRIIICDKLNASGTSYKDGSSILSHTYLVSETYSLFDSNKDQIQLDLVLKESQYVIIESGSAIFTPYIGKPDLGFK